MQGQRWRSGQALHLHTQVPACQELTIQRKKPLPAYPQSKVSPLTVEAKPGEPGMRGARESSQPLPTRWGRGAHLLSLLTWEPSSLPPFAHMGQSRSAWEASQCDAFPDLGFVNV